MVNLLMEMEQLKRELERKDFSPSFDRETYTNRWEPPVEWGGWGWDEGGEG